MDRPRKTLWKKVFGSLFSKEPSSEEKDLKNRAPRVRLSPLNHIEFHSKTPTSSSPLYLANLSASGVGLIRGSFSDWPEEGDTLEGDFLVGDVKYPATLRIVHFSPLVVGCTLEDPSPDLQKMITGYFDLELSAVTMKKQVSEHDNKWFFGENNCELFLEKDGNRIMHFHLTFFGNYIEGGRDREITIGYNPEEMYPLSDDILTSALRLIANIQDLTALEREVISDALKKARQNN